MPKGITKVTDLEQERLGFSSLGWSPRSRASLFCMAFVPRSLRPFGAGILGARQLLPLIAAAAGGIPWVPVWGGGGGGGWCCAFGGTGTGN